MWIRVKVVMIKHSEDGRQGGRSENTVKMYLNGPKEKETGRIREHLLWSHPYPVVI